jgi:TRAP-type C4-dicarboxylate transport system substrate-binding protein
MGPQLIQNFRDAGITVHELDAGARNKFRAATEGVKGKFKGRTSKAGKDLLKAIEKAL